VGKSLEDTGGNEGLHHWGRDQWWVLGGLALLASFALARSKLSLGRLLGPEPADHVVSFLESVRTIEPFQKEGGLKGVLDGDETLGVAAVWVGFQAF
jgi:hypothetical protein